ncbi:MAG: restriction endonuclease subunit S [Candidatus Shapirobacteria bacterium]
MTFSIIQKSQLEGARRLDAEYFQPEYLSLEKNILETKLFKKWGELKGEFITGPFGSEFNIENYTSDNEYRYLRGKDVKPFFVLNDDNVYMPKDDFDRLKKYSLRENDLLLSVVGTLGNVAIVSKNDLPSIFSCKSTIFRAGELNALYLLAYLNSKYGRGLILRNARGQVQTGLNIEDLKSLMIYIPPLEKQNEISIFVEESRKLLSQSKDYYLRAEELLLEELGLKDYKIEDDLFYEVNLSELRFAHRADPEYFQPKYSRLIQAIKNKNAKPLGDLVSMKKGFEPGREAYQEEGKVFIRVSSVSKFGIEEKDQKYLSEDNYQQLKQSFEPKVGEILLTKDATPGVVYTIKEPVSGIISGGVLRLKAKSEIDPEFLSLYINSVAGQMQVEQDSGGSVIAHWKPEQIKSLLVPVLPKNTQQKIADLVKKSHEARKKSKELLEEAKRKVEEMIRKGAGEERVKALNQ